MKKVTKTDSEWQQSLSSESYQICRKHGTEPAFTGAYHATKDDGVYHCICCATPLFSSKHKFDSGTGWPSYYQTIASENVATKEDKSFLRTRTEVLCAVCDAHLGHVFPDGPQPTGLRYCINSASLDFK